MASNFDTTMQSTNAGLLTLHGETIQLDPNGIGSAADILAIVRRETRQVVSGNSSEHIYDEMIIDVKATFASGSAYTAKEFGQDGNVGDDLTIDAEHWYVAEVLNGRKAYAGMYSLRCKTVKMADPAELL